MTTVDRRILGEAERMERCYLQALRTGQDDALERSATAFFSDVTDALQRAELQPSTLASIRGLALRLNIVSRNLVQLRQDSSSILSDLRLRSRDYLSTTPFAFTSPTTTPATTAADLPTSTLDDSSLCDPYRDWFLSHFTNPYPTASDKDHLLRLVPSHDKKKLDTWFTNNRRRSGWQALRRSFTDGTAEDFQRLLDAVDQGDEGVSSQAREKVRGVRRFFEDGSRDKVSDEIQQIVEAAHGGTTTSTATASASRRRSEGRVEARATRGIGAFSSSLSSPSSDFAPPLPRSSPYARPTPSTPPRRTARVASVNFSSSGPRYPSSSTFSSPTSSLRSALGSSASSLDSLVSYASLEGVEPLPLPPASSAGVPSSPPASSSLLSFAGSSSSSRPPTYSHSLRTSSTSTRRAALPAQPMHPPNPYFCTLDELSTASSALAFAGVLGGRLSTTPEGDLLVE